MSHSAEPVETECALLLQQSATLCWPGRIAAAVLALVLTASASFASGPVGIGWTPMGTQTTAGYAGPDGKLVLFDGGAAGWVVRPAPYPHPLVPGAPIAFLPQPAGASWPTVITVSPANKLVQIVNGGIVQSLQPALNFPVGAQIEHAQLAGSHMVFAVDGPGDLWAVDPATAVAHKLNTSGESFPHGCSVTAVAHGTNYHVCAVDHFGTLWYYNGHGGMWSGAAIGGGLLPGCGVAAEIFPFSPDPVLRLNVAMIDAAGQLLLFSKRTGMPWDAPIVIATGQNPGSLLELGKSAFGPMVSTISAGGDWNVWIQASGTWTPNLVGAGFLMGAPIACAPAVGTVFTVDPIGRLVCANWSGSGWTTGYAVPTLSFSPVLVSRKLIPNPDLPPARVTLKNTGKDPLLVQVVDLFDPRQPPEQKIDVGAQIDVELLREAGGVLEEVYLVPGPAGTLLEQTASHNIPPAQRYSLVVWENRETYKVLPFKNPRKGAPKEQTEGFTRRSNVSLGVIPVPPGALLRDQDQMDVVQITKRLKNPGAVVHFAKPLDQP